MGPKIVRMRWRPKTRTCPARCPPKKLRGPDPPADTGEPGGRHGRVWGHPLLVLPGPAHYLPRGGGGLGIKVSPANAPAWPAKGKKGSKSIFKSARQIYGQLVGCSRRGKLHCCGGQCLPRPPMHQRHHLHCRRQHQHPQDTTACHKPPPPDNHRLHKENWLHNTTCAHRPRRWVGACVRQIRGAAGLRAQASAFGEGGCAPVIHLPAVLALHALTHCATTQLLKAVLKGMAIRNCWCATGGSKSKIRTVRAQRLLLEWPEYGR